MLLHKLRAATHLAWLLLLGQHPRTFVGGPLKGRVRYCANSVTRQCAYGSR